MDARLKTHILAAIVFLLFVPVITQAQRREIAFPMPDGEVSVLPEQFAFSSDGQLGFAVVYTRTGLSAKLFSFSVAESRVVDEFDLVPDFGVGSTPVTSPLIFLKVHTRAGIIILYGTDANNTQKLLALSFDAGGHLGKLWLSQFPVCALFPAAGELAFNQDGTNIYLTYYVTSLHPSSLSRDKTLKATTQQTDRRRKRIALLRHEADLDRRFSTQAVPPAEARHLALIRAGDGAVVTTVPLSFSDNNASVFFNEGRNQLVVLASGTLYVFKPGSDSLDLQSKIERDFDIPPEVIGVGISQDSRFLIAYGSYTPLTVKSGVNNYVVYDLELNMARVFQFDGKLFAISNDLTFHRATGRLIVPMKVRARETEDGTIAIHIGGFRAIDILSLSGDGTLVRNSQIELPERSPGTSTVNGLLPFNNAVVSQTGAIAFIASGNGHVFSIGTLTGEIINDEPVDSNSLEAIQLLEPLNLLAFGNRTNKLTLVENSAGPVISSVSVKKRRTVLKGKNFLAGTRVYINGVDAGSVDREQDEVGFTIIINRGKKDYPPGQEFSIVVVNPDGLESKPYTFRR